MRKFILFGLLSFFFQQLPVGGQSRPDSTNNAEALLRSDEFSGVHDALDFPEYVVNPTRNSPTQDAFIFRYPNLGVARNPTTDPHRSIEPVQPLRSIYRVRWLSAINQSLLYTGIMRTFTLWTEAGTRDSCVS